MNQIGLVGDTGSYWKKEALHSALASGSRTFVDLGVTNDVEQVADAMLADRAVRALIEGWCSCCILLDVTGNGLQIHANKYAGIRAIPCFDEASAEAAVIFEQANMCALYSGLPAEQLVAIAERFLVTSGL